VGADQDASAVGKSEYSSQFEWGCGKWYTYVLHGRLLLIVCNLNWHMKDSDTSHANPTAKMPTKRASDVEMDIERWGKWLYRWLLSRMERLAAYIRSKPISEREYTDRIESNLPTGISRGMPSKVEAKEDEIKIVNGVTVNLTRQKVTFQSHTQRYDEVGLPWQIIRRCTAPNAAGSGIVPCEYFRKSIEELNTIIAKMNKIWKEKTGFRILYVKGGNVHLDPVKGN